MNKQEKEAFVAEIKGRLERAQATFLVDYKGLNVETINALRNELRKSDTEFQVVKNRLLNKASQDTDTAAIREYMVGPSALAISYEDAVGTAKVLVEQSKGSKHLEIKGGQIAGKAIGFEEIKRLAALPNRDVLLAQVLSTMNAVPTSLVRVLNAVMVDLLNVLKALESKKDEDSP